ncbi:hypothetical protein Rsl_1222 [Rickettsia slovaca 13-B]|uniref:Uncharacterized protein n=1 Tax=Rickettsia slovaca (strain 13-B) TaxID=941638 RepID=A0ABN4AAF4_RICS1|nr:hypothetical protein Rsl_1222 [Rickettsia slovaca 13-B]
MHGSFYVMSAQGLLCGPKNPFGVMPWLDHDIQKHNLKY